MISTMSTFHFIERPPLPSMQLRKKRKATQVTIMTSMDFETDLGRGNGERIIYGDPEAS